MIALLREHKSVVALGAFALVCFVVALAMAHCQPPPPAKTETVTFLDESKLAAQLQRWAESQKSTRKRARTVKETYRPDGSVASRTTRVEGESSTEQKAEREQSSVDASRKTDVRTVTVTDPARAPRLALNAAAEWQRLELGPSGFRLGADVPVGKVPLLRWQVRAGAEAHFSVGTPTPDGVGITLRVEVP